jgi:hypothetical protein
MLRPSASLLAPHLTSTYHFLAALPLPLVTTSFTTTAKPSPKNMHIYMAADTTDCAPCSVLQKVAGGASNYHNQ